MCTLLTNMGVPEDYKPTCNIMCARDDYMNMMKRLILMCRQECSCWRFIERGVGCIPGVKRFKQKLTKFSLYSCMELSHLHVKGFTTGLEKASYAAIRKSEGLPTSEFRLPRTYDFWVPTSDFWPPISDFCAQISVFWVPTSDFRGSTSKFK